MSGFGPRCELLEGLKKLVNDAFRGVDAIESYEISDKL
jgi:hypothetical protein